MQLWQVASLGAAMLMSAGCAAHRSPASPEVPSFQGEQRDVTLDVANHNWLDVVVYVVHGGQRTRLAMVTAAGSASFVVPDYTLRNNGQIRLLAHAVGDPNKFMSETIVAKPGMTIDWTIETDLKRSSLAVW